MKKYILLVSILVSPMLYSGGIGCGDCDCTTVSHSFFSTRPLFGDASPERSAFFRDRLHARQDGYEGAVQLVLFGSRSTEPSRIASFFGPNCKQSFTVVSADQTDLNKDIVAEYLGIYVKDGQSFESTFCFAPEQTVIGLGITKRKGVYEFDCGNWLWVEFCAPLEYVRNKICINESVKTDGELLSLDAVGSVSEAFRQSSWEYGRIDPCCRNSETRLAFIDLKLGYEWLVNDCCFLESYVGISIPTGNRVTGRYVFEPIVGYNHHTGAMVGTTGVFEWWRDDCCDCVAQWVFEWSGLYLFEKVETRSFDLKGKPWSRYMPVYANKEQAQTAAQLCDMTGTATTGMILATPGINVFTQPMCVKPRFAQTFNTAFILDCKCLQAEIGYNVYARSAECVRLACCWQEGPALKTVGGCGNTNKYQLIGDPVSADQTDLSYTDYEKNIITECDLDLQSAAHPAIFTQTVYGALGCQWCGDCYPSFASTGFSYEFASSNAGLDRWVAWIKAGVSF